MNFDWWRASGGYDHIEPYVYRMRVLNMKMSVSDSGMYVDSGMRLDCSIPPLLPDTDTDIYQLHDVARTVREIVRRESAGGRVRANTVVTRVNLYVYDNKRGIVKGVLESDHACVPPPLIRNGRVNAVASGEGTAVVSSDTYIRMLFGSVIEPVDALFADAPRLSRVFVFSKEATDHYNADYVYVFREYPSCTI